MNRDQRSHGVTSSLPPQASPADLQTVLAVALQHHQSGHLAEAERLYRQILAADADHADALHLLGVIAHQMARNDIAADLISRAIAISPHSAAYHSNLGNVLNKLGRLDEALAACEAAIRLEPDLADAHSNRGMILHKQGRLDEALEACETAIRLKPDMAEAHSNLGVALRDLGRLDDAAAACATAIRLRPEFADAYAALGNIVRDQGRLQDAVAAYRMAIDLDPAHADARLNLGSALMDLGQLDEAVAAFEHTLSLKPDYAEAYSNLGLALCDLGRLDEALAACAEAVRLKPDHAQAHYNQAFPHLLRGNFAEGLPKYEWRWRGGVRKLKPRGFHQPQWQGEDIAGRTLLLHAEQGLGDTIQFCRYAPLAAARGARVVLEAPRALLRLLAGLEGVDRLVATGDPLPAFDLHCPLMSLPAAFGATVDTVPAPIPYLRAEPEAVETWRGKLGTEGFKVGITWQGSPTSLIERGRSAPLACFAPLAAIPGVRLISLQKAHGLDQLDRLPPGMRVETLGRDFDEGPDAFIDTAAAMMSLDLVVTIDTSIGHLAGALGRPVWTALKFVPHWVWMLGRDDSPWYPSTRLFRQATPGDWDDVFARMAAPLGRQRGSSLHDIHPSRSGAPWSTLNS